MTVPSIDEVFKSNLPDNLFYDHYRLAALFPPFTPQEWRTYLRDNALFIDSEMAAMVEPAARAAVQKLGSAHSSEVQALKSLMETSKLINDSQKQQVKVVMTFIPPSTGVDTTAPTTIPPLTANAHRQGGQTQ